jgi:hypothetical protein
MKKLIFVFLLIGSLTAQANLLTDSLLVLDFKQYKMNYPATWRIKEGCLPNECTLLAPMDTLSRGLDTYYESINLTFNPLPSASYTVDNYAQYSVEYLPKVVKGFKILEKKKLKPNTIRLTYTGEKNSYQQTWRQYFYVKASKVYIVTFSTESPKYAYYQAMMEPFLNSFMLK